MDGLAPLWNSLLQRQQHTLFQSFVWNRLAAEMFSDRSTPHVVCVESDVGVAIVPACINLHGNRLELIGETLFDYRDVLHTGDPEILRLAWREIAKPGLPLHVVAVRAETAEERWPDFAWGPFTNAPRVDRALVDESAFRYEHSRSGRLVRRLSGLGIELHTYSGTHSAIVRKLYDCKRTQFATDAENLFTDQRRCDFMMAAAALPESRCDVFTLEHQDGTLVAGLVTFRDTGVRRFYTIYFHPAWPRHSPGVALLYEATSRSLGEGLSCDYMTGEYPYKLRLANASRPLYKVEAGARELAEIASGKISRAA
jgi:CelD/BcsL family acetyltransferase involved in cellulose biosynthesis